MKTRNKRITLTIMCLLSVLSLLAQIPVLEWAINMGGINPDRGQSIAVDALGNIYTTGQFYGTADFDPGAGEVNLISAGGFDIFAQKLDTHGNLLWVKQIGGTDGLDKSWSIAIDISGNVYTIGRFRGTLDFDPGAGTTNLTATGEYDVFIQKLDTNGNFLWAKQMGGFYAEGFSIVLDSSGNIYSTGLFWGTVDFDPGPETANLTAGDYDVFVQKLDTNGNFLWAKQMGGPGWDQGNSIAVDATGNIYIAGYFTGTKDFDPGIGTLNLTSAGDYDVFVQKLDTNGDFLWARQMGGVGFDEGESIAVDDFGNIYITGYFNEIADFDPGMGKTNLISAGSADIFIQKLDTNGDYVWAKQIGGIDYDHSNSIAIDISGNVYIIGQFLGTVDFDPGTGTANLTAAGGSDIFVQILGANGNFLWAKQLGGTGYDEGLAVVVDSSVNVYITGYFKETADFDPYEGETYLTTAGNDDIFVQKLYPCYPTDPVPDVPELPELSAMCEITVMDAPVTTATSNCVGTITASPDVTFPITDQSVTQIVWTYDDKNGNVVTQNQTINWIPIDVTTSLNGDTITANNGNGTYRWLYCDDNNTPLSGEIDQLFIATASGNYAVEITENGCVDTSACISIIISSLSEFEHFEKLVVYPNPSSDNFKIEFGKVVKGAVLKVTDIQGKLVSTTQIQNSSEASIKLNEAPGIYLLTIKSKEHLQTIRLIKE